MTTATERVHLRWMIRMDMQAVYRIEAASYPDPLGADGILRTLRERNCIGFVAETGWPVGGIIAGYMIYLLARNHVEILTLAVAPEYRRRGIGMAMALKLQSKLYSGRRTWLSVKVREGNAGALAWLKACGFRATGLLRGYYDDTGEDGVLMQWRLKP